MLHPHEADLCMPIPPAGVGPQNRTDDHLLKRTGEHASPQIPRP